MRMSNEVEMTGTSVPEGMVDIEWKRVPHWVVEGRAIGDLLLGDCSLISIETD